MSIKAVFLSQLDLCSLAVLQAATQRESATAQINCTDSCVTCHESFPYSWSFSSNCLEQFFSVIAVAEVYNVREYIFFSGELVVRRKAATFYDSAGTN
jgi:hypothetical protein